MHIKKRLIVLAAVLSAFSLPALRAAEVSPTPTESTPVEAPKKEEAAPQPPAPPAVEKPHGLAPLPSSNEITHNYENAFVRMMLTLGGLIVLVIATFWLLRRVGKGSFKWGNSKSIHVLERRPLSPKSMLYLVQYENKKILVAESQMEIKSLATFEEEVETDV